MKLSIRLVLIILFLAVYTGTVFGQVDDICGETGIMPSLDSPFARVPYIYGRIGLTGVGFGVKFPRVTITFTDGQQPERLTVGKSGNYCFKRKSNGGGSLSVEIDGVERGRRTFSSFGPAQQREDFEISLSPPPKDRPPGVVAAEYARPANPKTIELYKETLNTEAAKDYDKSIGSLKEIVSIDPTDHVAWAKLGSLYFLRKDYSDAVAALRKALEINAEYTPAWIYVGQIRMEQKQFEAAIEILKHAATIDPRSARIFQLLGEAYLQSQKGTLGIVALNEAVRLDPVGMAECHLQMAHLYQLAGARKLASREYKIFLTKVPNYPDKKTFEKFIKNNPEQ